MDGRYFPQRNFSNSNFPNCQLPQNNFPNCQLPQLPTSPTTVSPSSKLNNFPNVKKSILNFANHIT